MASTRYPGVDAMIAALQPSYPVMCFWPQQLMRKARLFRQEFPGRVLYAVKCNPHPMVLRHLYQGGIRHFDTASLKEVALVSGLFPDVRCYFNHPVKSRAAIETAYQVHGVRDFVIDHISELHKLSETAGPDITVEVRLATPPGFAAFDLSTKFGASEPEAIELLRAAHRRRYRTAIAFHVGSQCRSTQAYAIAVQIAARVIREAGVPIAYLNVGGGFPAPYGEGEIPSIRDYIRAIEESVRGHGLGRVELVCEPGRALVAEGASLVVQVTLRKGDQIYVNDGIFGFLSELYYGGLKPPVRPIRLDRPFSTESRPYKAFGPTCDSMDVFPSPLLLPSDIREGDWIEIGNVGAYSNALATDFNGFGADTFVTITEPQPALSMVQ